MKRVALSIVMLATVVLVARAQSTTISGRVVKDESGDPLPNARVTLTITAPAGAPVVLTDGDGRFAIRAAAGRQSVVASKSGYARSDATPAIAGEPIEIRLRRGATISGRIVDEFGDPVIAARVAAQAADGSATNPTSVANADADDRGEYRLAGLPAGTFLVAVMTLGPPPPPQMIGNNAVMVTGLGAPQRIYYPGVSAVTDAQSFRLQVGEERNGIDLVVPALQATGQPFGLPPMGPLVRPLARTAGTRAGAILRGRVVSTDGVSVAHAQVRVFLEREPLQSRSGSTDAGGRFEFVDLPPGKVRVIAAKPGYSALESDGSVMSGFQIMNSGRVVDLTEGETREGIDISLARWGTLSGRVFDEYGDPIQGARVQMLHVRYEAGRRRLVPAGAAARVTDDLGRYRLYAVPPGRYVVSASVGEVAAAELPGYTRSYFPGTPNAGEAQFVSIDRSQDVVGIDVSMSRTRTARIAGKLLNAAGEPTTGGTVTLTPSVRSTSVTSVPAGARITPSGLFEFTNVPPGQYIIQASRGRNNKWTEGEFGALPVSVDGADVTDLVLQTSTGSSIRGRFTFDSYNGSQMQASSAIELSPIPVDFDLSPWNQLATTDVDGDGRFEMRGINGPRRLQLTRVPNGWALKEILVNRIDVTDRPLPFGRNDQSLTDVEVVLTDRVTEITGTIADDRSRPAPGASVILFPMDRDRWYPASRFLRKTVSGSDGLFTVSGLPIGSYHAAGVARLPADGAGDGDAWQDPAYLESLIPRATTVTLGDAQKVSVNLRVPSR